MTQVVNCTDSMPNYHQHTGGILMNHLRLILRRQSLFAHPSVGWMCMVERGFRYTALYLLSIRHSPQMIGGGRGDRLPPIRHCGVVATCGRDHRVGAAIHRPRLQLHRRCAQPRRKRDGPLPCRGPPCRHDGLSLPHPLRRHGHPGMSENKSWIQTNKHRGAVTDTDR